MNIIVILIKAFSIGGGFESSPTLNVRYINNKFVFTGIKGFWVQFGNNEVAYTEIELGKMFYNYDHITPYYSFSAGYFNRHLTGLDSTSLKRLFIKINLGVSLSPYTINTKNTFTLEPHAGITFAKEDSSYVISFPSIGLTLYYNFLEVK